MMVNNVEYLLVLFLHITNQQMLWKFAVFIFHCFPTTNSGSHSGRVIFVKARELTDANVAGSFVVENQWLDGGHGKVAGAEPSWNSIMKDRHFATSQHEGGEYFKISRGSGKVADAGYLANIIFLDRFLILAQRRRDQVIEGFGKVAGAGSSSNRIVDNQQTAMTPQLFAKNVDNDDHFFDSFWGKFSDSGDVVQSLPLKVTNSKLMNKVLRGLKATKGRLAGNDLNLPHQQYLATSGTTGGWYYGSDRSR